MKALIYKDLLVLWNYCRRYLLICIFFLVGSVFIADYDFLQMYPLILIGTLVSTTIAYDERDKWDIFALSLPFTRKQIVTAKYLLGLVLQSIVFLLTAICHWLQLTLADSLVWDSFLIDVGLMVILATGAPSFMLPFVFKNGSEKGRMAYMISMGILFAVAIGGSTIVQELNMLNFQPLPCLPLVIAGLFVLLYLGSWALSVRWYEKREF